MDKPAKGLLGRLRRSPPAAEPEPELSVDRLAALRIRAAVAEDPSLGEDESTDDGLGPVVLARAPRETATSWDGAASWFGGLPKLGAIAWPLGSDGLPLPFAAQIGLAGLAAASPNNPLPISGSLAFFLGEGAVIHVPEGVTQFAAAPGDTALSQFWPAEPVALTLPAEPADFAAVHAAMDAALPATLPRRHVPFAASQIDWNGPVPVWWHGVDHTIGTLRLALADAAPDGRRDGLSALIGALAGFAADRSPWHRLNAEEHEVFAEALANAWQQFGGLLRHPPAPRTAEDVATVSILAMMTGDETAFAALPATARDAINRDHRLPVRGLPQMFGLPMETGIRPPDDAADLLLLQLPPDDMLGWHAGTWQFWIGAEEIAQRRWDTARLAFEPS